MAVKVKGFSGVACTVLGPEKVWEPITCFVTDAEGNEYEEETGEGEWVEGDGSRVRVRMVGDDHVYVVEVSDCTEIEPEDYCDGCGQIGCAHGSQREA